MTRWEDKDEELAKEDAISIMNEAQKRAHAEDTIRSKVTHFSNALAQIQSLGMRSTNRRMVRNVSVKIRALMHTTRLKALFDAARLAEQKGTPDLAIGYYEESLRLIADEEIPGLHQEEEARRMRARILELSRAEEGPPRRDLTGVSSSS
jgi:hypothetical protein